jgi:hypothetical protein
MRGLGNYVLDRDGRTPILEEDTLAWAKWFEANRDARRVARTEIGSVGYVSTVFLGLDHSFGGGRPVLFETMSFIGGESEDYFARYHTWAEAEAGHARIVREALAQIETTASMVADLLVPGVKVEGEK